MKIITLVQLLFLFCLHNNYYNYLFFFNSFVNLELTCITPNIHVLLILCFSDKQDLNEQYDCADLVQSVQS